MFLNSDKTKGGVFSLLSFVEYYRGCGGVWVGGWLGGGGVGGGGYW